MHRIVFCGSTSDSVLVLDALSKASASIDAAVVAVVTQPPKPVGRKKIMTPTPVHQWAEKNNMSILTFPQDPDHTWRFLDEQAVTNSVSTCKPDILITAVFGQKIPGPLITAARFGGVNIHPSLLPRWRGADPMPWTILSGDAQTGVTLSEITEHMDEGAIFAQKKYPVTDKDTPDALRTKLFSIGAELLVASLPAIFSSAGKPVEQKKEDAVTARKMRREDGYIPWELVCDAIQGKTYTDKTMPKTEDRPLIRMAMDSSPSLVDGIYRMFRALSPWPGLWTTVETENTRRNTQEIIGKRLKLIDMTVRDNMLSISSVQLEGKTPVSWKEFSHAYLG